VSEGPERVAGDFALAVRIARSGRAGPVHLSLPTDCLELPADIDHAPRAADFGIEPMALGAVDAEFAIDWLHDATRPVILAGPSCMTRAGRERLAALEQASGVPAIGMESPRGIADPALGAFGAMLARATNVLLVGKRLDYTLKFGESPAFHEACEFVQIDAEAEEIERTRNAVGSRLRGHARARTLSALEALARAALGKRSAKSGWLDEVRSALAYRPPAWDHARSSLPGRLHPAQAMRPLQAMLDAHPDSVFVCDGGEIGQWAQACLRAPHRVVNGVAGSIGAALPFALAARIAQPTAPVIAVMGDGTFGFHCAEIDTAVRHRLPFVAVVGNDARWNAEYQIQLRDYGRERLGGCELLPTRYDQVAAGFGGHGELVTDAAELMPAAQRAAASNLPACLNVMIEGLPAPNIKR
jgi:acetolactate synthase-1/2/3 large subunit